MSDVTIYLDVLLRWLPLLLFIGIWIYVFRSFRSKSGMAHDQYQEELFQEEKRHNAQMEELQTRMSQQMERIVNKVVSR